MTDRPPRPLRDLPDATAPHLLDALTASIADAMYVIDHEGRLTYVNPACVTLLGYDDEAQLLGRPSHATFHHHHPDGTPFPERDCPLLRARSAGETVRIEEDWFFRADGTTLPVACSSAPVEVAGRRGAVVVFRDVTARRAAEEAARREEAERAQAQEVRASRARLMEAGDAERRRLGRDLHDGAQQRLVHVVIDLQRARSRLAEGDPAIELLDAALTQTRAAIADLRELAAGLDPSILTNKGLRAAVESLTARSPFAVTVDIPDRRFARAVETTAYFVIAEALTNAAKHAGARAASVRVEASEDALTIDVHDDGRGGADIASGSGLRGLADRLAAVDGVLEVDGGPGVARGGGGTHIHAELPLSAGSQDATAGAGGASS